MQRFFFLFKKRARQLSKRHPKNQTKMVQEDSFKVRKFPVIMQRGARAESKEEYKGEMSSAALKDLVNLHSESGMGEKVMGTAGGKEEVLIKESKPWLVQEVPGAHREVVRGHLLQGRGP